MKYTWDGCSESLHVSVVLHGLIWRTAFWIGTTQRTVVFRNLSLHGALFVVCGCVNVDKNRFSFSSLRLAVTRLTELTKSTAPLCKHGKSRPSCTQSFCSYYVIIRSRLADLNSLTWLIPLQTNHKAPAVSAYYRPRPSASLLPPSFSARVCCNRL